MKGGEEESGLMSRWLLEMGKERVVVGLLVLVGGMAVVGSGGRGGDVGDCFISFILFIPLEEVASYITLS